MASCAVLIGVPKPQPSTFPDIGRVKWGQLLGVENDLGAVRRMLVEAIPHPLNDLSIVTLIDPSDTTAANINERLDYYVGQLKAGDTFVLMLSGHGYRVPDIDGDEGKDDGWDEVFIASDGIPLLDDDFAKRWEKVDKDVTIIGLVDTCRADTSALFFINPAIAPVVDSLTVRVDVPVTVLEVDPEAILAGDWKTDFVGGGEAEGGRKPSMIFAADPKKALIGDRKRMFTAVSGEDLEEPSLAITFRASEGASRLFISASLQEEDAFEMTLAGSRRGVMTAALTDAWSSGEGARRSYETLFKHARRLAAQYDGRQTTRVRFVGREHSPVLNKPPFSVGSIRN